MLWFSWALPCWGQELRGVFLGRILDQQGGAIPGAQVQVLNLDTNFTVGTITNAEGNYTVPYLVAGRYRITVELTGFKKSVKEPLELRTNERLTVDIVMEIGQITDTVTVTGEAPLLAQSTASTLMSVDSKRVSELPSVGGNPYYLTRISPGVASNNGRYAGNSFDSGAATGAVTVNGTRTNSNEAQLDGAPNMQGRAVAFSPPPDLVEQVRIETTSYDASTGHTAGANVNVTMKSGTNALHGTVYGFHSQWRAVPWHTNNVLYNPANKFTQQQIDARIPIWRHQRYGATGSGPIRIPGLFDGRDKLFWSFGYDGLHVLRNLGFFGTVPTAAERNGDFSALLALGSQYQIYDPATIKPAAGGRFSRSPLPGNKIPESRISPIAKAILPYWPMPNNESAALADGTQNYFRTQDNNRNNRVMYARIDYNVSAVHRMFFRVNNNYRYEHNLTLPTVALGNWSKQKGWGAVVDDVYTFSPSLLLNLRYGWTFQNPYNTRDSQGFDLTSLGLPKSLVNDITGKAPADGLTFPLVVVDGGGFTNIGSDGGDTTKNNYHTFQGTVTKVTGNHSLRFGAEYRLMQETGYSYGNVAPRLEFSTTWTRGPLDNSPAATLGQGLASFLLGIPTGGYVSVNASRASQSTFTGLYLHDDWKVTKRLTLNLGVRWEYEGAVTERFNRTVRGFDAAVASPIQSKAQANYALNPIPDLPANAFRTMGGLTFAGVGVPRSLWNADKNNFAPRVGLAFTLNPKTVVRAGYGIFYDVVGVDRTTGNQTGYSLNTLLVPSLDSGQTFVATLSNPFPTGVSAPPGSGQGLATSLGRAISFYNEKSLNPYMQRWSLIIQRELPWRTVAEIFYVGNRGSKIYATRNINAVPRQYYSTATSRDQTTINFMTANFKNPFSGIAEFAGSNLAGANISRSQLLRPYPQFLDINVSEPVGYSSYHSLQAQVEKRFSRGFTYQASYTWSKFLEATGYLNPSDAAPEKVISDLDYPHRFVAVSVMELPVGQGKWLLSNSGRILDSFLGGWQLQVWYEFQSALPLGFGNALLKSGMTMDDIRLPRDRRDTTRWFNVDAFDRATANRLEWNIRTQSTRFGKVRAAAVNNWDLSLFKNVRITEGLRCQVRLESFNALNHVNLGSPNTDPYNAAFGSINGELGHGQRQVTVAFKLIF